MFFFLSLLRPWLYFSLHPHLCVRARLGRVRRQEQGLCVLFVGWGGWGGVRSRAGERVWGSTSNSRSRRLLVLASGGASPVWTNPRHPWPGPVGGGRNERKGARGVLRGDKDRGKSKTIIKKQDPGPPTLPPPFFTHTRPPPTRRHHGPHEAQRLHVHRCA